MLKYICRTKLITRQFTTFPKKCSLYQFKNNRLINLSQITNKRFCSTNKNVVDKLLKEEQYKFMKTINDTPKNVEHLSKNVLLFLILLKKPTSFYSQKNYILEKT